MLDNAIKILKQRQQAIQEQLECLQAEAGKLEEALRAIAQLSGAVTGNASAAQPTKKRKKSAAGRRALAADRIQWEMGDSQKEAAARTYQPPEPDHRRENFRAVQTEQKSGPLVPASQMVPCTCGGINATCMYCAGTGMREPS